MEQRRRAKRKKQSHRLSFRLYQAFYGPMVFIKATYRQMFVLSLMIVAGCGHLCVL